MGIALYRKYRPQSFKDVTGQNHICATLMNELAGNAVAHAYLFTGPRGVGKTSLARIFAKALNCLKRKEGESEPCNTCDACVEQTSGRAMDVIEIDAASNTGVDNVRENVIEHVRFAPTSRKYKVFIIDEVHMLSTSAWNALLKTLEEPPAHAVFIMATTEIHKVPATIISRCQRFDFKRIPFASMVERLKHMTVGEGVTVDDAVIEAVVSLGDGCLRDAESLLEQVLSLDEKKIGLEEAALVLPRSNAKLTATFIDALANRQGSEAITIINQLIEEGVDLGQFTNETIEYLRRLLIAALGGAEKVGTDATKRLSASHIVRLINSFSVARLELKSTPIPQLPLELVAAEHCSDAPASQLPNSKNQFPSKVSNIKEQAPTPTPTTPPTPQPSPVSSPTLGRGGEGAVSAEAPISNNQSPSKELNSKIQTPTLPVEDTSVPNPASSAPNPSSDDPSSTRYPLDATRSSSAIPMDTLALRWDELCAAVQDENPSLPFLLRVARPLRFEDGELVIGVQYKLHADKLNLIKNKDSVIRGLTALYNCGIIPVRAEICAPQSVSSASDPMTSGLLQQFGGTVVE